MRDRGERKRLEGNGEGGEIEKGERRKKGRRERNLFSK